MARPRPVTWRGSTYPTTGWALGDVLLFEPMASDQRIAELLNVTPQQVRYWRGKAGIPEHRHRSANPYIEIRPSPGGQNGLS